MAMKCLPLRGVSNEGISQSGPVPPVLSFLSFFCPLLSFLSFFVLFGPFLSFLGLSRFFRSSPMFFGDFPDMSFSSFSAYQSTCKEHSQKRGRAKGAAKASCRETVVQNGVFGESVSTLPPEGFQDQTPFWSPKFGQPFLRTTPSPLL